MSSANSGAQRSTQAHGGSLPIGHTDIDARSSQRSPPCPPIPWDVASASPTSWRIHHRASNPATFALSFRILSVCLSLEEVSARAEDVRRLLDGIEGLIVRASPGSGASPENRLNTRTPR